MKHVACACAIVLCGFAPAPMPRTDCDPDKAILRFEQAVKGKDADAFHARKKKLIEHLSRLQTELVKKGKADRAELLRTRLLLLAGLEPEHLLGKEPAVKLLERASVGGKYRHLTRVLCVPADQANYKDFSDFGFWNGTSYVGVTDLAPGYWVYISPRWYIWRDAPQP
jgi:hypothetical protein